MNVSTIALDLDGTLLDHSGAVSARNRRALEDAVAAGIHVILCSGRHHFDVSWTAANLGLSGYLVSSNGALLTDGRGGIRYSQPLEADELLTVAEAVRAAGLRGICYTEDGIAMDSECPALPWYRERDEALGGRLRLSVEKDVLTTLARRGSEVLKVMVNSFEAGSFDALDARLAADGIAATSSAAHNREIMAAGTSKAVAVEKALHLLGCTFAGLLAVGDGLNDMEIIQAARFGIAMGNARDELKAVACDVCPPNSEDGVGITIERILSGRLPASCLQSPA